MEGVSPWDRGFRYGMAVFESIRVLPGRLCFWEEHFSQLAETAAGLRWGLDPGAKPEAAALLLSESRSAGEGFARLYLTAGDGSPSAAVEAPRLLLFFEPRSRLLPESYAVVESPEPHFPALPGVKTASYWGNLRALEYGISRRAQETLLFSARGDLVGAAMANVFLRRKGRWFTPHPSSGARLGVVRRWVMDHLPIEEALIQRADCARADAFFLTNSWIGVMPVHSSEGIVKEVPPEIPLLRERLEMYTLGCVSPSL